MIIELAWCPDTPTPLHEMIKILKQLAKDHGSDSLLVFDAGHNNVDASLEVITEADTICKDLREGVTLTQKQLKYVERILIGETKRG